MRLPVLPPLKPMLARAAARIPPAMHYEAKWDGFRAIVFRDGDEVEIGSRNTKSLNRYFPELVEAFVAQLPPRCVVDGEIVIVTDDHLDFDRLLDRIHPAASRVRTLAETTPASFVAFDLLALGDDSFLDRPMVERRAALEEALGATCSPVHVAPATTDPAVAQEWFRAFEGAGLDGIVAKDPDGPYRPDERAMVKVKHERTADCVVAGYRWHKSGGVVGSLLLGLYDTHGRLQHVGVSAAFTTAKRRELVDTLAPYRVEDLTDHPWAQWADAEAQESGRMPGAVSRWTGDRNLDWVPLRPELVCEVAYDHTQGDRFRHTARFRRWRPDRDASGCTYDQLEQPVRYDLADVLGL
ncbi:ATP-dependent DNA ligase [Streptomyces sp. SID3343]|uniref:ATP-dependent DNA ligase n=1 Tax=Streptomyces sp. SID3343 TaxID=2690260 RepID=UPI001368CABD|nr:ATP-dependent DNA ligase [Streptomyces sp. SID3343]MYV99805.1 ATP-dependent DNA ligase [Streptomyces sp. SID3343]